MARAQVVITLEDDGSVTVAGPLNEPILMYGLLVSAQCTVYQYQQKKDDTGIQLAAGPLPPPRH